MDDFHIEDGVLMEYVGEGGDVAIPDGVTEIDEFAFEDCWDLITSINIPASMTELSEGVFSNFENLTGIYVDRSNPYFFDIEGILFDRRQSTLVYFPLNKRGTFTIPEGVSKIADCAFSGSQLTSVAIPASVWEIGMDAFSGCSAMTDIIVAEGNEDYSDCKGILMDKEQTTVIVCPQGKTGVIELPDGVTRIKSFAFDGCANISRIVLPSSLSGIELRAFSECTGLPSIVLPERLQDIAEEAFASCSNLTSVVIPAGLSHIGERAFEGCSKLEEVIFTGSREEWSRIRIDPHNSVLLNANIRYLC